MECVIYAQSAALSSANIVASLMPTLRSWSTLVAVLVSCVIVVSAATFAFLVVVASSLWLCGVGG